MRIVPAGFCDDNGNLTVSGTFAVRGRATRHMTP
jgi:hypothetical protein